MVPEPFFGHSNEAPYESLNVRAYVTFRIGSTEFIKDTDKDHDSVSFKEQITSAHLQKMWRQERRVFLRT